MPAPADLPRHPALALPPRPPWRRGLWALPLLLSLVFVAGVLLWLRASEQADRDDQRQALISDALSLEAQVSARIDREALLLRDVAMRLDHRGDLPAGALATLPEVQQGLHRFWISLTWLDRNNRLVAQLPENAQSGPGLSSHLSAPLASGGTLVARYSPGDMLRQTVPWWLARRYDVRLIDSFDDVIASTAEGALPPDLESHRISLEPALPDGWLELIARDRIAPWTRGLPFAMVAVFVVLIAAITAMLRRQMHGVSRAEAAWRTEAAWRQAMEDSLTVGLRARDLEGRLVYVNRTLADMVGYEPHELVGLLPPMPYWPPDSHEEIMQRHRRNMAGQAPREGYEARWRHRDGRLFDVMVFEAPLVDARGVHIGWMGSILDMTERRRLEERERRQTETMAHHARLTMLGEVASTLAHELNQPLTAIASYNAGVMNSMQKLPAPDPVVMRALGRLGEQAAHAGSIVQRIREFLTRREPRLEPCALNAVIEGGVALLRRELQRQQVQVALQLDAALPVIVADAVLIEQVVVNLVRNAGDALAGRAGQSGERLIVAGSSRSADGRFVRIDVRDNGPGLGGLGIEALCAPFFSTKAEGMGMGLAICRSIIEAHHGVFDAAEAPGGGAVFTLTLPVDLAASTLSLEDEP